MFHLIWYIFIGLISGVIAKSVMHVHITVFWTIVLAHNVWSGGVLPILVTLFGWASLIKGMLLLVLSPETESRVFIVGLGYEQHPNLFATFALLLGVYMTYLGFSLKTRSSG
jgi:hypothetical protein